MIEELKSWIESGCNYNSGLALLHTLQKDGKITDFQFKLCQSAKTAYSENKMKATILTVIEQFENGSKNDTRKSIISKKQTVAKNTPTREKSKPVDLSSLPEDLQSSHREILDLYGSNRIMKGQLKQLLYYPTGQAKSARSIFRTKKEREFLAQKVVSNQKYIDAMWQRIDHFALTGHRLPGTEPVSEMKQIAMWLRDQPQYINYIRQANSKFRKTGIYNDKSLYDTYRAELDKIKKFIEQFL